MGLAVGQHADTAIVAKDVACGVSVAGCGGAVEKVGGDAARWAMLPVASMTDRPRRVWKAARPGLVSRCW